MGGIARLRSYLWRYWRRYLLGAVCLLATTSMIMIIPWWVRAAINIIEQGGSDQELLRYAVLIVVAAIAGGAARTFSRFLIFNSGRNVEYDLRNDLFAHLERLPLSYYQSQSTGDLMSRAINDINAVRLLLGPGILNLINAPLYFVYAAVLMFAMDARLTVSVVAVLGLLMWVFRRFRGRIQQASLKVQQQMSLLSSHVQENLSGMQVVKAYVQEKPQTEAFVDLNQSYQARSMDLARNRGFINPLMQIIHNLMVLIVLGYGGMLVVSGDMTLADLVAFILYLRVLAWPMAAFGWMISLLERGRAAMERLEEILKVEPAIADPPRPVTQIDPAQGIEFRNVSFVHGDAANGEAVLKDLSFKLPAGGKLAIVGRTGAGKSTLAHLVPRLFDVSAGEIRVGGVDVRSLSLHALRRLVGYVPQDPYLFSNSLRQNLRFGRDSAGDDEILRAVRTAGLERDLEIFPDGLDTVVGERGISLSGGQKQRSTLARSLVPDPPYLILDDCLSSVDAQTEREILQGLETTLKDKTCIVISHRISAIKGADQILVLEDGRIIERGDHESLLRGGGAYAQMYHHQQLSEELERI